MTSTNYATIQTGTISAQGPIIAIHIDGRVCIDAGGHVECGRPIGRHLPEKVVKPAVASASGHAMGSAS